MSAHYLMTALVCYAVTSKLILALVPNFGAIFYSYQILNPYLLALTIPLALGLYCGYWYVVCGKKLNASDDIISKLLFVYFIVYILAFSMVLFLKSFIYESFVSAFIAGLISAILLENVFVVEQAR